MNSPFLFQEFKHCRRGLTAGKSPGADNDSSQMRARDGPASLRPVLQHVAPSPCVSMVAGQTYDSSPKLKESGVYDFYKIRPISLFRVIRKMWVEMVASRAQRVWHKHGQHGTHSAILQVLNHLEQAGGIVPNYLTFWNIHRAFDSVPKWLLRLAWAQLGLDLTDFEWFLNLDAT